MLTRNQNYALKAYEKVSSLKERSERAQQPRSESTVEPPNASSYGVMAHKLPILIHTAGLAQALAFLQARGNPTQRELLNDLADTIGLENSQQLLINARTSQINEYILLTRQVRAALLWYKRFAQSELHVDVGDELDDQIEENIIEEEYS
jgi:CRISPR-associated protein Cmr5